MRSLLLLLALAAAPALAQDGVRSAVVLHTPDGFVLADVTDAPLDDGVSAVLLTAQTDNRGWTMRTLHAGERPAKVLANSDTRRVHRQMGGGARRAVAERSRAIAERGRAIAARSRAIAERDRAVAERNRTLRRGEALDVATELRGGAILGRDDGAIVGDGEILVLDADAFEVRAPRVRYAVTLTLAGEVLLDDADLAVLADDPDLADLSLTTDGDETDVEAQFRLEAADAMAPATQAALRSLRERAVESRVQIGVR